MSRKKPKPGSNSQAHGRPRERAPQGRPAGPGRGRRSTPRGHGQGQSRGRRGDALSIPCPEGCVLVWGRHAVEAVISNPDRRVASIYLTGEAAGWFGGLTPATDLPEPVMVDRARLGDALAAPSAGADKAVHQGAALVAAMLEPPSLEEFLDGDLGARALVVLLDRVTDARNIGAVMRSARAFGASALVTTDRNCPPEGPLMLRAASGAAEHVPLIRVVNLARAMERLKDHGFTLAAMTAGGDAPIDALAGADRLGIVMGAEGMGLRRLTLENADLHVRIPIEDAAESLNVSTAAAVALFAARQGGSTR